MGSGILDGALLTRTRLVLGGGAGPLFWAALAAAVLFVLLHHRRLRAAAPPGPAWTLTAVRTVMAAALVSLLLEPALLRQTLAPLRTRQTVLLDVSRSMSLPWKEGESRLDVARGFIRRLAASSPGTDFEVVAFDADSRPVPLGDLDALTPDGRATDLTGALAETAGERDAGPPVLVLTDGRQTVGGSSAPPGGDWVAVGIGSSRPLQDVSLPALRAADLGFTGKPLPVTAVVRAEGSSPVRVPLTLTVDGRVAGLQEVIVPPGEEREVTFPWTPADTGSFRVAVTARGPLGEVEAANNAREATVRIVRDRIRVLFIAGAPSWNYRFLREALKRDPSLDVISFIILRSPSDVVDAAQEEIALIPFPTNKLFTEELPGFDLVIFDNFSYRPYFPAEYLENLRARVRDGGGFWMWGGTSSFIDGFYRGTAVEEILPFTLEGPSPGQGYVQGTFQVRFPPAAERNPLFGPDLAREQAGAGPRLPPLSGFNLSGRLHEDAVVLVEHAAHRTSAGPSPIVALRPYGKGRVMAVATDWLWAWDFTAAGAGLGNQVYLEFVRNAVRWLTGDPILDPVSLSVSPEAPVAGDTVTLRARVLDRGYRPVEGASIEVTVTSPTGGVTRVRPVQAGEPGVYETSLRLAEEGAHRLTASASGPAGPLGKASLLVGVEGFGDELASTAPDLRFLADLAGRPGRLSLDYREGETFVREVAKALAPGEERVRVVSEERLGLAGLPPAFILALALLALDWAVRKRYRLE